MRLAGAADGKRLEKSAIACPNAGGNLRVRFQCPRGFSRRSHGRTLALTTPVLARLSAAAVFGIDAIPVSVEVDVSPGLPGLPMVGLPDTTVRESRDRVRTAIR